MIKILLKILITLAIVVALMTACRLNFDYLAQIALIDYIAYSGIVSLLIAIAVFNGDHPINQHFLSMMVHRELVSRENDTKDTMNKISATLAIGTVGVILVATSGVMAWLS